MFISEYLSYAKKCYIQQKCYYYLVTRETSTIFVYEKKPLKKLDGKINQLAARVELTNSIKERHDVDITKEWSGTVVMSIVEMAFLLSSKIPDYSYSKRYKLFMSYAGLDKVKEIVKGFKLEKKTSIKSIPFMFAKMGWNRVLFFATTMLHLIHYEFKRD